MPPHHFSLVAGSNVTLLSTKPHAMAIALEAGKNRQYRMVTESCTLPVLLMY